MKPLTVGLRRCWQHVARRVLGARAAVIAAREYRLDLGSTRIDPRRVDNIVAFLLREGLVGRETLLRPRPASLRDLARVHTTDYLKTLRGPDALLPIVGYPVDDELTHRALEAQRWAVGGTMHAVGLALESGRPAINLGGGFHHAGPASGEGFCIFNDVAVAIATAREAGFGDNVLIVDLDLHDGNGTRRVFADDASVFTFSIHNRTWSSEPAVAALAIELPGEVEDELYLETLRRELPPVIDAHRPRLVIYVAGTDPAADDKLGNWRISADGMMERDLFVAAEAERTSDSPLVVVLGGGYGRETWRYSARFYSWLLTGGRAIEPPTTGQMRSARNRRLARLLRSAAATAEPDGDDGGLWAIDESDVHAMLGGGSRRTRFLDHFSPHGIELLFERSGLLDLLRGQGFSHPTVVLDLQHPAGQTVRIFGDEKHHDLLIETRLERDRKTLRGFEMLRIEWLLMQNPRAPFSADRPPLPGQSHPGLGLLGEMMSLIVLLTRQLELDGLLFVPSHYHLAGQARKYLRFCDPADEAWYRTLRHALEGLTLAEATQVVAAGGVVERGNGETVEWRPMAMALPLSEELRRHFESADYSETVERLTDTGAMRLESVAG